MKLTIPRKGLIEALSLAGPLIKSRTPHVIMKNVRMRAADKLTLTASDNEVWLQASIDCDIHRTGDCLLPHGQVSQLMNALRDESVNIEESDNGVRITTKDGEFNIPTEKPAEFPVPPDVQGESFSVPGAELAMMLRRTSYCINETEARFPIGGVLFEGDGKDFSLVATDKNRLAVCQITAACQCNFIVPKKACDLIQGSVGDAECEITSSANLAKFDTGDAVVVTKLLEGRFPQWRLIVPSTFESEIRVSVDALESAVRQAVVFSSPESGSEGIDVTVEDGTLTVAADSKGKGKSSFPVDSNGAKVNMRLRPYYILDATKDLAAGYTMTIKHQNDDSSLLFDLGCGTRIVAMPLRRA